LPKVSHSRQAAGTLGVDRRTVERDLARGKKISPEVLADVQNILLDKGVVLDGRAHGGCRQGWAPCRTAAAIDCIQTKMEQ
jgi:hypothetical protein